MGRVKSWIHPRHGDDSPGVLHERPFVKEDPRLSPSLLLLASSLLSPAPLETSY